MLARNNGGDVLLLVVAQEAGFLGPELEEARACIYAMKLAHRHGLRHLQFEGDCLSLITSEEEAEACIRNRAPSGRHY